MRWLGCGCGGVVSGHARRPLARSPIAASPSPPLPLVTRRTFSARPLATRPALQTYDIADYIQNRIGNIYEKGYFPGRGGK